MVCAGDLLLGPSPGCDGGLMQWTLDALGSVVAPVLLGGLKDMAIPSVSLEGALMTVVEPVAGWVLVVACHTVLAIILDFAFPLILAVPVKLARLCCARSVTSSLVHSCTCDCVSMYPCICGFWLAAGSGSGPGAWAVL